MRVIFAAAFQLFWCTDEPEQPCFNLRCSLVLQINWHAARQFLRFYPAAGTRYQVHSPFVFEWANAVLEDQRWYYAFDEIERIRSKMLHSPVVLDVVDFGAVAANGASIKRRAPLRQLARVAASSAIQGRRLFRLANWLKPARMLELGTSVGIGAMYLASGARQAQLITLEGSEACAHVARTNLEMIGLNRQVRVMGGPFAETLAPALGALGPVDLVYFDGNHRQATTLQYFEQCLEHAHAGSVFVFDDIYWSAEMLGAWHAIQGHVRVTLTVDCFDLGFAFFNPDVKSKQHFQLLPARWKPWKMW